MELIHDQPVLLSLAVFLARVADVSLGTVRTILVFRAYRFTAAIVGFFEVLIWIAAAGAVLSDLSAWYVAVAYALGFATGTYLGIWLDGKLGVGMEMVRVLSRRADVELARRLREDEYSVTEIAGQDDSGSPVEVLLIVAGRRKLPRLLRTIEAADPDAVWTISDVKRHRPGNAVLTRPRRVRK